MADRNRRKTHLTPFGIVVYITVFVVFFLALLAIVPKNAKWWQAWDTSYRSSPRDASWPARS
jgi:hypothetical protein